MGPHVAREALRFLEGTPSREETVQGAFLILPSIHGGAPSSPDAHHSHRPGDPHKDTASFPETPQQEAHLGKPCCAWTDVPTPARAMRTG